MMDGIHDLGGMHGFGPIPIVDQDYVFRHEWQRRAFGITEALAGATPFNADMHRQKVEQIDAVTYLESDYFDKWVIATSALLKDAGLVSDSELASGRKEFDVDLAKHAPVGAEALVNAMKKGAQMKFPDNTAQARFGIGDRVRVRSDAPKWHTRAPRYVRGKVGQIIAGHGVFQLADSVARGLGPSPQHCYMVAFSAGSLWGDAAEAKGDLIHLDLAESYLDAT
jgi:nitrile hydratase subunit beta